MFDSAALRAALLSHEAKYRAQLRSVSEVSRALDNGSSAASKAQASLWSEISRVKSHPAGTTLSNRGIAEFDRGIRRSGELLAALQKAVESYKGLQNKLVREAGHAAQLQSGVSTLTQMIVLHKRREALRETSNEADEILEIATPQGRRLFDVVHERVDKGVDPVVCQQSKTEAAPQETVVRGESSVAKGPQVARVGALSGTASSQRSVSQIFHSTEGGAAAAEVASTDAGALTLRIEQALHAGQSYQIFITQGNAGGVRASVQVPGGGLFRQLISERVAIVRRLAQVDIKVESLDLVCPDEGYGLPGYLGQLGNLKSRLARRRRCREEVSEDDKATIS